MRAKKVNELKKAYVFDFDDTLVKTDAKILVSINGKFIKALTPNEYNNHQAKEDEVLDFSEFDDPKFILQSKKYKIWPVLQNIYNAKKSGRSNSDIFILTARTDISKYPISSLFKRNNIDIPLENILTIGDDTKEQNIAKEKLEVLKDLKNIYDHITYFDDNIDNIETAKELSGIHIRLVD